MCLALSNPPLIAADLINPPGSALPEPALPHLPLLQLTAQTTAPPNFGRGAHWFK